jgi:hypothetical protein
VGLLALKLLLAPACVVAVSLAGRRWGMAAAGILGGLPVVAGPILLVLTLQHGTGFGSDAAAGTLLGLAALTAFVVVYGRGAERLGPARSVFAGWGAFLLVVALLDPLDPAPLLSLVLVAILFRAGLALLPGREDAPLPLAEPPGWDLPARALSAAALVVALTAASGALGPGLSGLLAPFPIMTSVLAVFTHAHGGTEQLRVLLRSFLVGFNGFATFCFFLAVAMPSLGTAAAFLGATAAALAVQGTAFALHRRLTARSAPLPQES